MKFATRETLKKKQRKTTDVEIDGEVYRLRAFNGATRDAFESSIFKEGDDGKRVVNSNALRARLVSLCWIDPETNERVYGDDAVGELNEDVDGATLERLFVAAQKLNGMDQAAIETAAKNSGGGATAASGSA